MIKVTIYTRTGLKLEVDNFRSATLRNADNKRAYDEENIHEFESLPNEICAFIGDKETYVINEADILCVKTERA